LTSRCRGSGVSSAAGFPDGSEAIEDLDFVLLTHIHLDHVGGTAAVLRTYPQARVYCHASGVEHLLAPERLWQGSRAVLGSVAEVYGAPAALPEAAFASERDLAQAGIQVLETPGHAWHHVSFLHESTLYLGEAAGTFAALPGYAGATGASGRDEVAGSATGSGERFYLRPATPPRFFQERALRSLDLLLAIQPPPRRLAFAHYGLAEGHTPRILRAARDQLSLWVSIVSQEIGGRGDGPAARVSEEATTALLQRIQVRLEREDPLFARLADLPADIQERERHFARQSLLGICGERGL
jgi:glyoxylase-like metal-dependent hydrolase (beta-lactamase superfamily II)